MTNPLIEHAVAEGVARITLNRPEKRNALSPKLIEGLRVALEESARQDLFERFAADGNR